MANQNSSSAWQGMSALLKLFQVVTAGAVIFGLAYLLGYTTLIGPLKGNDSALHIAYATWLDQYFPQIPHWYPLQGGGESILHGYPVLAHLLVVALHRLSGLSILQAYRLLSFLTFPVTALGIYFLGWLYFRKQTVGLIAAMFFLLAPITWTWMYDWGFFAQSVAMVFLPYSLICFDRYLSQVIEGSKSVWRGFWFLALVLSLALASLTHLLVGTAAVTGIALFTAISSLTAEPGSRGRILIKGLLASLASGALVALILAFYLVPFYRYSQVANREGLNNPAPHQLPHLPVAEFLGISPMDPTQILTRMQFPLVVTIFFVIGLVLALWSSRKALTICLVSILGMLYVLVPELPAIVLGISPTVFMLFNFRTLLMVVMVFLPIGAAFGTRAAARVLVSLASLGRLQGGNIISRRWPRLELSGYVTSGLALVLAGVAILQLGSLLPVKAYYVGYGPLPEGIDFHDIWDRRADDFCNLPRGTADRSPLCEVAEALDQLNIAEFDQGCALVRAHGSAVPRLCDEPAPTDSMVRDFLAQCQGAKDLEGAMLPCRARVEPLIQQLAFDHWPAFDLGDEDAKLAQSQRLAALLPDEPSLRIDVSPYLGRLAQDLVTFSGASQINSYTFQISLVHGMWGYQQNVFFSRDASPNEYGSPEALNNAAQWFGIQYVFLNPELDPIETYQVAGWQEVFGEDGDEGPVALWRNPGAPQMATASARPAILVVGQPGIYATIMRLANEGLLPYQEALLAEGQPSIDRYTLADLEPFDALFLYGYDYQDSRKAWEILEAYVEQGGSLFVDTGWEFVVPEWEFEEAPAVLPVARVQWTDYDMDAEYSLGAGEIAGDADVSLFKPLIWEGQAWGLSGTEPQDVRDWGQVVLRTAEGPLIVAGEYGQGKVVWSGMNLIGHAMYQEKNDEEIRLLHNLLTWLTSAERGGEPGSTVITRESPDRVELSFSTVPGKTTWLYWREAYYPNWHAYLVGDNGWREIPIYRGGPGFMLMPIETTAHQAQVVLSYEMSTLEWIAALVSLLTLGLLAFLVLDSLLVGGRVVARLGTAVGLVLSRLLLHWVEGENDMSRVQTQATARDPYPRPEMNAPRLKNLRPNGDPGRSASIKTSFTVPMAKENDSGFPSRSFRARKDLEGKTRKESSDGV